MALFKTSEELKQFMDVGSVNFNSALPTLRFVENQYLVPLLGLTLYTKLHDSYQDGSLTTAQAALLIQVRAVVGPYFCFTYANKVDIKLSDAGMQRAETDKLKTAYQYQTTNFKDSMLFEGEYASEQLLSFLESKQADYPLWTSGPGFDSFKSLFIKTGTEFQEFFPSQSPYRNYNAMRPTMVSVEEHAIRMAIGDDLFDALKTADKSGPLLAHQKKLLRMLKFAIANYTVALSIPLLSVRIDAGGITVMNAAPKSTRDGDALRTNAAFGELTALATACKATADNWIQSAQKFISDNATAFNITTVAAHTSPVNPGFGGAFGLI